MIKSLRLCSWVLLRSLRMRLWASILTVLAVLLGVGIALVVPLSIDSFQKGSINASRIFDLLITAEGSQIQAVLNSIYYQDLPLSNMPYHVFEALKNDPRTVRAVPLGFGDNVQGYPIVGTSQDYFELREKPTSPPYYQLAEGSFFAAEEEAVIGSQVAKALNLSLGDTFKPAHGFTDTFEPSTHAHEYTVVGILKATGGPSDRAIYTDIASVWEAHGQYSEEEPKHEESHAEDSSQESSSLSKNLNSFNTVSQESQVTSSLTEASKTETSQSSDISSNQASLETLNDPVTQDVIDTRGITAILWAPKNLNDLYAVANYLNNNVRGIQAIFPGSVIGRLNSSLGQGRKTYGILANLVLVLAIITVALNTFWGALQSQKTLAILRAVGVPRGMIALSVIVEALLLSLLGIILGILAAYTGTFIIGTIISSQTSLALPLPQLRSSDWLKALVLLGVAVLFSLLPALSAARKSPLEQL